MSGNLCIGIDFGSSKVCASVWKNNHIEIIPNNEGNLTTPNFIAFTDNNCLLGSAAKNQAYRNTANTIFNYKNLIGRRFDDAEIPSSIKKSPFAIIEKSGRPYAEVSYQEKATDFSPEDLACMIISYMKNNTQEQLGKKVTNAIITVPSYYTYFQRQGIKNVCNQAGINVPRIINDTSAAAIAYCDKNLGGDNFDENLVNYYVNFFKANHKVDLSGNDRSMCRLRKACEQAKRSLSSSAKATIMIDSLYNDIDLYNTLSRETFEQLNKDLFKRLILPIQKVLKDANLKKN
ncbi:heat shock protein 70 [Neocallimastix californiae]|uniref:Heat shock protein 70 n=1 Tax=Neocallimastix californiae TaxID=1754190 RepID=A0A1Y2ERP8_9FUNG|nr:heat shock protein 70 [Neocallimastix californiae]|eukprot:ORY74202.1 heat shock protein 70 [Neocallimastix californiae]